MPGIEARAERPEQNQERAEEHGRLLCHFVCEVVHGYQCEADD